MVTVALATGCARPPRPAGPASPAATRAIIAALAAREQAMRGRRVAMTVRSGAGVPALLAAPVYLAVDGPEALRLQVLSPFGVTVLDLAVRDGAYELTLPLRGETRRGAIDFAALATSELPASERMVIALALLFRSKTHGATCRAESAFAVVCAVAEGVVAHVTVDDARRPVRERYARADGTELVRAEFADYADDRASTLPGRMEIHDPASGTSMIVRVLRVRDARTEGLR